MNRRIFGTIGSALLCLIFGWIVFDSIVNDCESNCNMLLLMSIITALGVIVILETHILKVKAEGRWHYDYDSTPTEKPQPSNKFSHALISSWFRIILTTLLISLPIFWQLSFMVIFGSAILGFSIDVLFRSLTNQLAPEMPE